MKNEILTLPIDVTKGDLNITLTKGSDITKASIIKEYTFENGFSDIEWVLIDP